MKLLAVGNSFSEDSTSYLQSIAKSAGVNLFVRNLYIGGCSLETHSKNIKTDEQAYIYQCDASPIGMISLNEALDAEDWDIVTLQQNSGNSGDYSSYQPYLSELIEHIESKLPKAKISFIETWAYEIDSNHPDFVRYGNDQIKMYENIISASEKASQAHGIDICRVGEVIQRARSLSEFDYQNGGLSLCRDGFHLSLDYGRFLAGLVWYKFFCGHDVHSVTYRPNGADEKLIRRLMDIV